MADVVKTVEIRAEAGQVKTASVLASRALREVSAELSVLKAKGGASSEQQAKLADRLKASKAAMLAATGATARLTEQLNALKEAGKGSRSEITRLEHSIAASASRAKVMASQFDKLGAEVSQAGVKAGETRSRFEQLATGMSLLKGAAVIGLLKGTAEWLGNAGRESVRYQGVLKAQTISTVEAAAATKGMVDDYTLIVSANKAVQGKVVKTARDFAKLAEATTRLGMASGQDAAPALDQVTEALAKGSSEVLNNLGVYLKVSEAQEAYAMQLGKTVQELDATEKAEAFAVIGLQRVMEAADATGISLNDMSTDIAEASVKFDNMARTMSNFAVDTAGVVVAGYVAIGDAIGDAAADVVGLNDSMTTLTQKTRLIVYEAEQVAEAMDREGVSIRDLAGSYTSLAAVQKELSRIVEDRNNRQEAALNAADDAELIVGYTTDEIAKIQATEQRAREKRARAAKKAASDRRRAAEQEAREIEALVNGAIKGIAAGAAARESVSEFFAVYEQEELRRIELAQQGLDEELMILDLRLGSAEEGSAEYLRLIDERTAAELAGLELQRQVTDDELALAELATESKRVQLQNQIVHAKAAAAAEKKIQDQRWQVISATSSAIGEALGGAAVAALNAADGEERAAARSIAAYAKSLRDKMIITAVTEAALAVASAASFNVAGAAAHGVAAGQATAAAIVAGAVAGAAGAIAGPEPSSLGPASPSPASNAGPEQGGGEAAKKLDVPVSHDPITSGLKAIPQRPLSVTVVLDGPIFAEDKETVGRWLLDAVAQAEGYSAP